MTLSRLTITEESFRTLAAQMPFYKMAETLDVGLRTITWLACKWRVRSQFGTKPGTAEEAAMCVKLREQGLSQKAIAEAIGRSQDFVSRRLAGKERRHPGGKLVECTPWPKKETTMKAAMGERRYDSVRVPAGPTVDGNRMARRARVDAMPLQGSAAAMCAGA